MPFGLGFQLVLVTDEAACRAAGRSVLETCERALSFDTAGRVALLLRDKHSPARAVEASGRHLLFLVAKARAPLLVHSHVDVATRLGAAGAHLASMTS